MINWLFLMAGEHPYLFSYFAVMPFLFVGIVLWELFDLSNERFDEDVWKVAFLCCAIWPIGGPILLIVCINEGLVELKKHLYNKHKFAKEIKEYNEDRGRK